MKANIGFRAEDLAALQMAYASKGAQPVESETPQSMQGSLRAGILPVQTASRQAALVSLRPLAGEPLSPRDQLYCKTLVAASVLDQNQSALEFVEQTVHSLPKPSREKEEFARTPLDDNLCRLKGLFADLQRPVATRSMSYDEFKASAAKMVDLLAQDCRRYVLAEAGKSTSMQAALSAAEMEAVQNFNHLRQVMVTVMDLPVEDDEIYLETKVDTQRSLDDADRGGMNQIFSSISYSGTNRPFYMRYTPYYVMSLRAPLFINALSRPRQLQGTTTRPGPLTLPAKLVERYGVPAEARVSYHSVSRYGLSNQTDKEMDKMGKAISGPPMRYYYTFQDNGVTKVLSLDKKEHFYTQLVNRTPLTVPADLAGTPADVQGTYVMYERPKERGALGSYVYQTGSKRLYLTQQQHQQILQHNAAKVDLHDPNSPVHFSYAADGSLESVMNRIFNDNAVRVISNKNNSMAPPILPEGYKDKMQLMDELLEIIRPSFQAEQNHIEELRMQLFRDFAAGKIGKPVIEDTCRKTAVASLRKLLAERRLQVPAEAGLQLIERAAAVINKGFDEMYSRKADEFARMGAARALYAKGVEPFRSIIEPQVKKNRGYINPNRVLEDVTPEDRRVFDAMVLKVQEQMDGLGGLKYQLRAAYWGSVTQYLVDLAYGPEGTVREGKYIESREGLPRNSREFTAYLKTQAPELLADPAQVAHRMGATFNYFDYNVSPYYTLPWANLYRNNDLLRSTERENDPENTVRDEKTIKPHEGPVEISLWVDNTKIRMLGLEPRDVSKRRPQVAQGQQPYTRRPSSSKPAPQTPAAPAASMS